MILFVIKILISTALGNSLATSYTSLGLAQKGITKEGFLTYGRKSCETYKEDCEISQDRLSMQQHFQNQCSTDGIACFRLGLLLRPTVVIEGKSIPSKTSYDDAIMYFKKSCDLGIPEGCTYLALQQKDLSSIKKQCLQQNNIFSCREHYLKQVLEPQHSQPAQVELSNLCTEKEMFLACGDLGIYYSGIRQDKKAVPLLQDACSKGDARACYWFGHHIKNGDGIERNALKSQELFQISCDSGIGDACMALLEFSTAEFQDVVVRKACLKGSARGCVWLGNKGLSDLPYFAMGCQLSDNQSESCLIAGLSLPQKESFWYFKRSCQTGNSKGCYHTYERYAIQENISEGVPFLSQSCQMGYMLGCETLAKLQLLQKAPMENLTQPVQLLEMACRSGQESACSLIHIQARPHIEKDCKEKQNTDSCYTLIRYLDGSLGGKKDITGAFALAKEECEGKQNVPACVKLGYYILSGLAGTPNKEEARRLFVQACSSQNASGCYNLGLMYFENHDLDGGFPFFQQACTYKDGRGCAQAGIFLRQQGKDEQGITLLEKSCSLGDATGCAHFGYIQARQNRIEDAISTLGYSCSYGHPDGCFNFAIVVHQNRNIAQMLFSDTESVIQDAMHRACTLGHNGACQQKK